MALVFFNEAIVDSSDLKIGLSNRAFRYGDAVFETIKLRSGFPMHLKYHYSRFILGMDAFKMLIPEQWSFQFLMDQIRLLMKETNIYEGSVRLQVFRKDGGRYLPTDNEVDLLIEISDQKSSSKPEYKLGLYEDWYKPVSRFSPFKTSNAALYVQAAIYAKQNALDDVIILNDLGRIADAVSSNIFAVVNKRIITPPENEGGVDGVCRRVLIQIARKEKIELFQAPLSRIDIDDAGEIFLSNATRGIQSVSSYNGKSLSNEIALQFEDFLEDLEKEQVSALRKKYGAAV